MNRTYSVTWWDYTVHRMVLETPNLFEALRVAQERYAGFLVDQTEFEFVRIRSGRQIIAEYYKDKVQA